MKRKEFLESARGLPLDELKSRAKGVAEELMKLRFRKATGQLEQHHRLGQLKRELARLSTCIAEANRRRV